VIPGLTPWAIFCRRSAAITPSNPSLEPAPRFLVARSERAKQLPPYMCWAGGVDLSTRLKRRAKSLPRSSGNSYCLAAFGVWRSLVAHLVWDQGVGGSNPLTPIDRGSPLQSREREGIEAPRCHPERSPAPSGRGRSEGSALPMNASNSRFFATLRMTAGSCRDCRNRESRAPVAHLEEQRPSKPPAAGSNPAGGTVSAVDIGHDRL
jgi:hypothetical protein